MAPALPPRIAPYVAPVAADVRFQPVQFTLIASHVALDAMSGESIAASPGFTELESISRYIRAQAIQLAVILPQILPIAEPVAKTARIALSKKRGSCQQ
jgi:hypothetical protein